MQPRIAKCSRETRETSINVYLNLDGQGDVHVQTGYGFADHMLNLLAFWAGFDLTLTCTGDVQVDMHHSLEDSGLCLGEALYEALKDKAGIRRVGWAKMPMDEALTECVLDISGRPYLVYEDDPLPLLIAGEEKDVWREFFKSFAFRSRMNLHMHFLYGRNGHHLLESACKGLGLCLRQAVSLQGASVLSTKGSLD